VVFPWFLFPVVNRNSFLEKAELRKIQALASEARAEAQMKTKLADAKKKYVSLVTRKYLFLKLRIKPASNRSHQTTGGDGRGRVRMITIATTANSQQ